MVEEGRQHGKFLDLHKELTFSRIIFTLPSLYSLQNRRHNARSLVIVYVILAKKEKMDQMD